MRSDRHLLTVKEAAHELSVSRVTIYELLKNGSLKSVKIGMARRVLMSSVLRVVNKGASIARRRK